MWIGLIRKKSQNTINNKKNKLKKIALWWHLWILCLYGLHVDTGISKSEYGPTLGDKRMYNNCNCWMLNKSGKFY